MIDQLIQKIESEYLELRHPFPARDVATLGQSIPALRDTFHGELVIYWSNLAGIASRVRKLPLRLSADLAFDRTYVAQSFAEKLPQLHGLVDRIFAGETPSLFRHFESYESVRPKLLHLIDEILHQRTNS